MLLYVMIVGPVIYITQYVMNWAFFRYNSKVAAFFLGLLSALATAIMVAIILALATHNEQIITKAVGLGGSTALVMPFVMLGILRRVTAPAEPKN